MTKKILHVCLNRYVIGSINKFINENKINITKDEMTGNEIHIPLRRSLEVVQLKIVHVDKITA